MGIAHLYKESPVQPEFIVYGLVSALVLIYLVVALLRPEQF
jgi:K+-transporting ATPase KdpF subunit